MFAILMIILAATLCSIMIKSFVSDLIMLRAQRRSDAAYAANNAPRSTNF